MAALRMASMATEAQAKAELAAGRKAEGMRMGAFSVRCAQLSDEFEKSARRPAIFRPQ
jgi:hypothetical protein